MASHLIIEPSRYDLNRVLYDREAIRRVNPQRFEMEQLTAVVYEDLVEKICVGYRDITDQEFWVRGHMPGMPLMPGVVMCEAAAQLCSFFTQQNDLLGAEMVGFGGLEEVRFRDVVTPGDRFVVVAKMTKVRRGAMIVSRFQGLVNGSLVVDGLIKGIPLPVAALKAALQKHQQAAQAH